MFHLPESVTIEMGTLEEGAEMYRKAIIDFFAIPPEMLEDEKPR
jgi:hypothetical protein